MAVDNKKIPVWGLTSSQTGETNNLDPSGDPLNPSKDFDVIGNAAFESGDEGTTVGGKVWLSNQENKGYVATAAASMIQRQGAALPYLANVPYNQNAPVLDPSGSGQLYYSLVDDNIGNALTDVTKWSIGANIFQGGNSVGDLKLSVLNADHGQWLICNGQEASETTYSTLFAVVGTAFNTGGEVAGNFRVPDFRGRVAGGIGAGSGLTPRSLGDGVGEENHILTSAELPSSVRYYTAQYDQGRGGVFPLVSSTQVLTIVGGDQPFNVTQPTLFGGNYFIFSGV